MCGKNDVNNILCVCGVNSDCICNIDHNKSLIDTKNNNNDSTLNISKTSEVIVDDKIQIKSPIMINTNNNNNNNNVLMKENSVIVVKRNDDDILSIVVQWTRRSIQKMNRFTRKMQRSRAYKIICRTTQPAHIISVGILSFVLLAVWPNILQSEEDKNHLKLKPNHSALTLVTYLGSFAAHFGAQIWMTFVSGLSLYFALPRHTFGLCQQILFPKYFAMNSILSIYTLIMFIKMIEGKWEYASRIQVIALTVCAVIEVFVRLYLAPPLLRLMKEKHKFESSTGSGQEIGYLNQGGLVRCPHYQKVHKSFRKIHMLIAMGNITTLLCTFLHLHYLASKIRVS